MRKLINEYLLLVVYIITSTICLTLLISILKSVAFKELIEKGMYR